MSEFLESVKKPLEDRVRYGYGLPSLFMDGLNRPTYVARQLADGRWQTLKVAYNAVGKPTRVTDPVGRQTNITYAANEIDLAAIEQKTSSTGFTSLMQVPSYSSHRPDAYTSAVDAGAAFEYDSFGLVVAVRTPLRGHMVETRYVRTSSIASPTSS